MTLQTLIDQDVISAPLWDLRFCQFDSFQRCIFCKMFSHVTLLGMTENPDALPSKETSAKCGLTKLNWGDRVLDDFWGFGQSILTNSHFGQTAEPGTDPSHRLQRRGPGFKSFTSICMVQIGNHLWLNLLKNWMTFRESSSSTGHKLNWTAKAECWMILGFWAIHPYKCPLWTDSRDSNPDYRR